MTYQTPDRIINHYKKINLESFYLDGMYIGNLEELDTLKIYPFKSKPINGGFVSTDNWKGYTATFRLSEKGNLILEYYGFGKFDIDKEMIDDFRKDIEIDCADEFPNGATDEDVIEIILDELQEYDNVQNTPELLEGHFWMCVRESINSPKIYIPFRNGIIVNNKEEWIEDNLKSQQPSWVTKAHPPPIPTSADQKRRYFPGLKRVCKIIFGELFRQKEG